MKKWKYFHTNRHKTILNIEIFCSENRAKELYSNSIFVLMSLHILMTLNVVYKIQNNKGCI